MSYNGRRYPTAEHRFQISGHHPRLAEHIRGLPSPHEALRRRVVCAASSAAAIASGLTQT
ncbi:hypothetical protein PHLGIDRAFT_323145 [Phlebiopsis gigantea 11061_1 CR5-6]|uniref:Uncharacterized protein n=1 Tax=Phlebiopsis gigantea (strain 11061_1 CR5-6) TaxID=745531 RepID=A0A0C3SD73_PHLG1|nr:hypothetical protein PHLGIDRAFT_323145 [Phlebiopsis gigantea 11061_1 CR5-6]